MGLKIPKIAYRVRDEDGYMGTVWLDLYRDLFYDRVLFLSEDIDTGTLIRMQSLLYALREDYSDIYLYINSSDGGTRQAIGLYDTITTLGPDVCTLLLGFGKLAPSLILTGGADGKRGALPHARLMIQQLVADHFSGPSHILELREDTMLRRHDTVATIFARHTGKPLSVIKKLLEREEVMSATKAKAYGIIDFISKKAVKGETQEEDDQEGDFDPKKYKSGNF